MTSIAWDELFVRVIAFDKHFTPPIDGPLDTTGVCLVEYLIDPHRTEMRRAFIALVHALDHEAIRLDTQGINASSSTGLAPA